MRRADRLFLLIQALRGKRAITAARLADTLGVSVRTVYRDVQDLVLSGVPVEGEAGVGYWLRRGADIPPLMFTREELEALVVGARLIEGFGGSRLARSAEHALLKIEGVLPEELKHRGDHSRVFAPPNGARVAQRASLDALHQAIDAHRVTTLDYAREDGTPSRRQVEPLCLAFWGHGWTLGAWCRLRGDFRNFRVDRMRAVEVGDERFEEVPGRDLAAYLRAVGADRS